MENGDSKFSWDAFAKGFFVGGLIGATLALLFAPKSGRELREDIKQKSSDLKKDVDALYTETKSKTTELWEEGLKQVEHLKTEAEEKLRQAKAKATEIIEDTKKWAEGLKGKTEEKLTEATESQEDEKKATKGKAK